MKNSIFVLAVFFLISCNSDVKVLSGDLYFKLVDISPSSGMSKEQAESLKSNLQNNKSRDSLSESELEVIDYLTQLEKNSLLESPFIYLEDSDKPHKIFLSKKEYEKVKLFTLSELNKTGKKVKIELEYELKDGIYYSDKILKITESPGQTPWRK